MTRGPCVFSLAHFLALSLSLIPLFSSAIPLPIHLPFRRKGSLNQTNPPLTEKGRTKFCEGRRGFYFCLYLFFLISLPGSLAVLLLAYLERDTVAYNLKKKVKEKQRKKRKSSPYLFYPLSNPAFLPHLHSRLLIPFPSSLSLFFLSLPEKSLVSLNLTHHPTN